MKRMNERLNKIIIKDDSLVAFTMVFALVIIVIVLIFIGIDKFFIVQKANKNNTNYSSSNSYKESVSTKKLYKFIPGRMEYVEKYINSGMPTTPKIVQAFTNGDPDGIITSAGFIYLSEERSDKGSAEVLIFQEGGIVGNGLFFASDYGKRRGYEFMFKPMRLYLEDVPGAVLDVNEFLNEAKRSQSSGINTYELTKNGVLYQMVESTSDDYIMMQVQYDVDYVMVS